MANHHLGDPCIHCGIAHDDVLPGPCNANIGLAAHTRTRMYWQNLLADHEQRAAVESKRLRDLIVDEVKTIALLGSGFDEKKIATAESFLFVGNFADGGEDRQSVINDAIKWFAEGEAGYYGLSKEFFGTKNYNSWRGQRSDHLYGCGPAHGSTCFAVGLKRDFREYEFSAEQKDAAIYYLMNLPIIQKVRAESKVTVP